MQEKQAFIIEKCEHVALLRWEQLCRAPVKNAAFPRAISAPCIIKQQLREPSRQRGPSLPSPLPGIRGSPSVTACSHVLSLGEEGGSQLLSLHPPTPPTHTSLDRGHALEGPEEPGPSPAVPTSCPGTAPAGLGLFLRSRWQLRGLEIGTRVSQDASARKLKMVGGAGLRGQLPARAFARPALLHVPVGPQTA